MHLKKTTPIHVNASWNKARKQGGSSIYENLARGKSNRRGSKGDLISRKRQKRGLLKKDLGNFGDAIPTSSKYVTQFEAVGSESGGGD